MRKKLLLVFSIVLCVIATTVLSGCGKLYDYEDLSQYINDFDYKGMEYDKSKLEVTDSEIDQKIKDTVKDTTTTEKVTEGTVEDGDTVIIDYKGTVDGESLQGGSADDQELKIGSKTFIDGFESGLIGKNIGDEVTLNLTFPKDYSNKSLASKDVQFDVKINAKKVTHTPEYNDEWAKTYSNSTSTSEFREQVKTNLLEEKKANLGETLIKQLVDKVEVKEYPEKEIDVAVDTKKKQAKKEAAQQNISLSKWYSNMGVANDEEFASGIREATEKMVKEELVVYYIAKKENLVADSKDVDDYYDKYLKKFAMTEEHFKAIKGESVDEYKSSNNDEMQILLTKLNVANFLIDNGKPV